MTPGTQTSATARLILHCGVQKTATTSLQRFLQRNAAALSGRLEVFTPVRGSLTRDLGHAAMQFSLDPSAAPQARFTGLIRRLRDRIGEGPGVALVSHENLPGAMIGKRGVVTLYPQLERIADLLDANLAPLAPEFVFYTRDMAAWKRSVHNQAVRSDAYAGPFATFLDQTAGCGTWEDLALRMMRHLGAGRVAFFRLEDETDDTRPGRQLLRHAGLSGAEIAALTPIRNRSNPRLNPGSLEFLRLVNGLGLEAAARSTIAGLVAANQNLFSTREVAVR